MSNGGIGFFEFVLVVAGVVGLWRFVARGNPRRDAERIDVTPGSTPTLNAARSSTLTDVPVARADWQEVLPLYALRARFFNAPEGRFYRALLRATSDRYFVFAKVRLLDLCAAIPGRDYVAMNKISMKHVDFLLCHPATLRPLVAFEVDGPSHQRADRIERDAFVDAFFRQIGIPLVHVPIAPWFEPAYVSRLIADATATELDRTPLAPQTA